MSNEIISLLEETIATQKLSMATMEDLIGTQNERINLQENMIRDLQDKLRKAQTVTNTTGAKMRDTFLYNQATGECMTIRNNQVVTVNQPIRPQPTETPLPVPSLKFKDDPEHGNPTPGLPSGDLSQRRVPNYAGQAAVNETPLPLPQMHFGKK